MILVFASGIVILAIVAVGGAVTAVRGQRWVSAVFWVVASLFLLGWLYGIAGQFLADTPNHAACYFPSPCGRGPGGGVPHAPLLA